MVCKNEATRLVNLNYPVHKEFNWAPQSCEEVNLQIEVGSLILRRQFKGKFAFLLFLQEFQSGSHSFKASDFPEEQNLLARMDIQSIIVSYKFDGIKPLVKIMALQKTQLQELAKAEEDKVSNPEKKDMNVAEALAAWEQKKKQDELRNEAMKKALQAKQAQRIETIKKAWEEKLPEVPREISTCWDR
jgi:type VI secretion system protein ImpL